MLLLYLLVPSLYATASPVPTDSPLQYATSCPTRDFINPCSCAYLRGMEIFCKGIKEYTDIEGAFTYLGLYAINRLLFSNTNFPVPNYMYRGMHVSFLKVADSDYIVEGTGSAFKDFKGDLTCIEFVNSYVDFGKTTLDVSVKRLEFTKCNLTRLTSSVFSKNTGLQTLKIDGSTLPGKLDGGFISYINSVESIYLQKCGLKTVTRKYFPGIANNLTYLDLRNNQIESLPDDMFSNMTNLKTVLLGGNSISLLPDTVWKSIWPQLTTIGLENNRIICNGTILWMFDDSKHEKANGQCAEPSQLENSYLKAIQKRDILSANS